MVFCSKDDVFTMVVLISLSSMIAFANAWLIAVAVRLVTRLGLFIVGIVSNRNINIRSKGCIYFKIRLIFNVLFIAHIQSAHISKSERCYNAKSGLHYVLHEDEYNGTYSYLH